MIRNELRKSKMDDEFHEQARVVRCLYGNVYEVDVEKKGIREDTFLATKAIKGRGTWGRYYWATTKQINMADTCVLCFVSQV